MDRQIPQIFLMYPFGIAGRPMHIFFIVIFLSQLVEVDIMFAGFVDNLLVRVWVATYKFRSILYTADNPFFFTIPEQSIDGGHCSDIVPFILF